MNARIWPILVINLLLVTSLAGCASFWPWGHSKPIDVITEPSKKTPLNLESPDPLRLRAVRWIVVTPQNAEQVFRQLESQGQEPVLFAVTDDGYMSLSQSIAEVRNFMNTQRKIIIEYKKYYEPPATGDKK